MRRNYFNSKIRLRQFGMALALVLVVLLLITAVAGVFLKGSFNTKTISKAEQESLEIRIHLVGEMDKVKRSLVRNTIGAISQSTTVASLLSTPQFQSESIYAGEAGTDLVLTPVGEGTPFIPGVLSTRATLSSWPKIIHILMRRRLNQGAATMVTATGTLQITPRAIGAYSLLLLNQFSQLRFSEGSYADVGIFFGPNPVNNQTQIDDSQVYVSFLNGNDRPLTFKSISGNFTSDRLLFGRLPFVSAEIPHRGPVTIENGFQTMQVPNIRTDLNRVFNGLNAHTDAMIEFTPTNLHNINMDQNYGLFTRIASSGLEAELRIGKTASNRCQVHRSERQRWTSDIHGDILSANGSPTRFFSAAYYAAHSIHNWDFGDPSKSVNCIGPYYRPAYGQVYSCQLSYDSILDETYNPEDIPTDGLVLKFRQSVDIKPLDSTATQITTCADFPMTVIAKYGIQLKASIVQENLDPTNTAQPVSTGFVSLDGGSALTLNNDFKTLTNHTISELSLASNDQDFHDRTARFDAFFSSLGGQTITILPIEMAQPSQGLFGDFELNGGVSGLWAGNLRRVENGNITQGFTGRVEHYHPSSAPGFNAQVLTASLDGTWSSLDVKLISMDALLSEMGITPVIGDTPSATTGGGTTGGPTGGGSSGGGSTSQSTVIINPEE